MHQNPQVVGWEQNTPPANAHLRCWAALALTFFSTHRGVRFQEPLPSLDKKHEENLPFPQHFPGWWLNQPILKICSSNWKSSPTRGENKKHLSCHHLVPVFSKSPISGTAFISMLSRSCLFKPNHHLWGDLQHTTPLSLFCPDVVFPREKSWSKSTIKTTAVTTAQKRKDFPCQAMTLNPKSVIHSSDASIWIFK